jgi:hypothetical protein
MRSHPLCFAQRFIQHDAIDFSAKQPYIDEVGKYHPLSLIAAFSSWHIFYKPMCVKAKPKGLALGFLTPQNPAQSSFNINGFVYIPSIILSVGVPTNQNETNICFQPRSITCQSL